MKVGRYHYLSKAFDVSDIGFIFLILLKIPEKGQALLLVHVSVCSQASLSSGHVLVLLLVPVPHVPLQSDQVDQEFHPVIHARIIE